MSYRRKSEAVEELRRYKSFCRTNSKLIEQSGIPSLVVEDYNVFIYFLGHGSTFPMTHVQFDLNEMNTEQRRAYLLVLDKYFEAGFSDPGITVTQEERKILERKHPRLAPKFS